MSKADLHGAHRLGRQDHGRHLDLPLDLRPAAPTEPTTAASGTRTSSEVHLPEAPAQVDGAQGLERHPGRVRRHQHLGEPVTCPGRDEQVAGLSGRLDRPLDTIDDHLVAGDGCIEVDEPRRS